MIPFQTARAIGNMSLLDDHRLLFPSVCPCAVEFLRAGWAEKNNLTFRSLALACATVLFSSSRASRPFATSFRLIRCTDGSPIHTAQQLLASDLALLISALVSGTSIFSNSTPYQTFRYPTFKTPRNFVPSLCSIYIPFPETTGCPNHKLPI